MSDVIPHEPRVRRIIGLSPVLNRIVDEHIDSSATPYRDLDEFAAVAFRNQLELDRDVAPNLLVEQAHIAHAIKRQDGWSRPRRPQSPEELVDGLLRRASDPLESVAEPPEPETYNALSFLLNRLNPLTITIRVLRNLETPTVDKAASEVGRVARAMGFHLQATDNKANVRGSLKRSVSWPVGDDEDRSIAKFVDTYLWRSDGGGGVIDLGLARLEKCRVILTALGDQLAQCPSPILGETAEGWTVGPGARELLRYALLANVAEVREMFLLFSTIKEGSGLQREVDTTLRSAHPKWSDMLVTSHRAAMLGRLRDLDVVKVDGRGSTGQIRILQSGYEFVEKAIEAAVGPALAQRK